MIVTFPREHRPHVEVFTVRDRVTGKRFHIFELVGRDDAGPFRIDVAHRHTLNELTDDIGYWWRQGIEVRDIWVFL